MSRLAAVLDNYLAPRGVVHGVLLDVLGAGTLDGSVVEAGTPATTREGDLVVDRDDQCLVVRPARDATMVAERPVALLRGAAAALPIVQALLDRCAAAEARA